jgi:hypothetical protein
VLLLSLASTNALAQLMPGPGGGDGWRMVAVDHSCEHNIDTPPVFNSTVPPPYDVDNVNGLLFAGDVYDFPAGRERCVPLNGPAPRNGTKVGWYRAAASWKCDPMQGSGSVYVDGEVRKLNVAVGGCHSGLAVGATKQVTWKYQVRSQWHGMGTPEDRPIQLQAVGGGFQRLLVAGSPVLGSVMTAEASGEAKGVIQPPSDAAERCPNAGPLNHSFVMENLKLKAEVATVNNSLNIKRSGHVKLNADADKLKSVKLPVEIELSAGLQEEFTSSATVAVNETAEARYRVMQHGERVLTTNQGGNPIMSGPAETIYACHSSLEYGYTLSGDVLATGSALMASQRVNILLPNAGAGVGNAWWQAKSQAQLCYLNLHAATIGEGGDENDPAYVPPCEGTDGSPAESSNDGTPPAAPGGPR